MASTAHALTGDAGERLFAALRQGYSLPKACAIAGVSSDTVRWWLLKGADPESTSRRVCPQDFILEPFWTFARELRAAQAEGRRHVLPVKRRGPLPGDISQSQQTALLGCLAIGYPFQAACNVAGIRLERLLSWLRLGGYPRQLDQRPPLDSICVIEPYISFVQNVLDAETHAFSRPN